MLLNHQHKQFLFLTSNYLYCFTSGFSLDDDVLRTTGSRMKWVLKTLVSCDRKENIARVPVSS